MSSNHPEGLCLDAKHAAVLFCQIVDPRRGQGKILAPILLFTVLAMLAGARSYRQVHAFIQAHLDRLNSACGLSLRRAPAYTSVRFIQHGLDAEQLELVFRQHAAGLVSCPAEDAGFPAAVAIDDFVAWTAGAAAGVG